MAREAFVIAQLSDLHCGSPYFDGMLLETAVKETIGVRPDLVVIGGDLTAEGYATSSARHRVTSSRWRRPASTRW